MSRIRPISHAFQSWQRRQNESAQSPVQTERENLPVPVSRPRATRHAMPPLLDCALQVQMLAKPAPRGLRASQMEQKRFHAAYMQAVTGVKPASSQKIA